MTGAERIAQLIAAHIRRANPIVGAALVADLGLSNNTPVVSVSVGGTVRKAVYLAPHAPQEGYPVFVCRMGSDTAAPLVVLASNFQIGAVTVGGLGTGGLGTMPLGG